MSIRSLWGIISLLTVSSLAFAGSQEYLIRFHHNDPSSLNQFIQRNGGTLEEVSREGQLYQWNSAQTYNFSWDANVDYVQHNQPIHLFLNPSIESQKSALLKALADQPGMPDLGGQDFKDNPDIQDPPSVTDGVDPLLAKQWGISMIGADSAYQKTKQGKDIVVAVTDTGVDYNHEDLISAIWHNKGEIAGNGIDDDKNGFVDDVIGWDFASNDNKPYDLSVSLLDIVLKGGNPGHGTHVSGVIGGRLNNSLGGAGVAPQVRIMPIRFINESGKGDDAAAVKAIDYAINNGANIINASWGGEKGTEDDKALKEALQRAQDKGVIFVAAAGNGRLDQAAMKESGFDNDSDSKPVVPASYSFKNIVAVAAIDAQGKLGAFSNWGHKSVKVGAPGVKIMSTVPGNRYQDTVIDMGPLKATWDGTSMAAPFVSGALAVIWSQDTTQTADQVIAKLTSMAAPIDGLKGKVVTEGRVDLKQLAQ